jgi:thioredoxin-dependent peroxiredoxin
MNVTELPDVNFIFREGGEFVTRTTHDLFYGKKVILFGLPGAFTPTCSERQLPVYEELYDKFKVYGVEEIYCVSVNDAFVMNAWAKEQEIQKVKLIPDGNGDFTDGLGMLVDKCNLGFAYRSWRYSALVDNKKIFKLFEEPNKRDNAEDDSYAVSDPHTMLHYLSELTGIPVPQ